MLLLLLSPRARSDWTRAAWSLSAGYLSPLNKHSLLFSSRSTIIWIQSLAIISHALWDPEPVSRIPASYFLLFSFWTTVDSDAAVVDAGMNAQPNGHRGKTQRIITSIFCPGEVLFESVVSLVCLLAVQNTQLWFRIFWAELRAVRKRKEKRVGPRE